MPECSMFQFIWDSNKNNLDDIALRYYGTRITYRHLFENVKKVASAFASMGVTSGDIVTIMSMQTPEAIYAIYALSYIGAIANMAYMTLSGSELVDTVNNTGSKMLLVLDAALDRVNSIQDDLRVPIVVLGVAQSMPAHLRFAYRLKAKPARYPYLTWKAFVKKGLAEASETTNHDAAAVIVYTSGTTGKPKGVVLSGYRLSLIAEQLKSLDSDTKRQESVLMILPPFIAFGISMIHRGLGTGMDMTLWIELDSDRVGKAFSKLKPNRFVSGPLVIEGIMRRTSGDLSSVYDITGGGEAIAPDLEDRFNAFLQSHNSMARYMTGYGMSELGSVVTLNWLHAHKRGSVGIPLPLTNVAIVDPETGAELGYNEAGEVLISTPCAMLGYYEDDVETDRVMLIDDDDGTWIRTGDLGYVDNDGFLFLIGRIKRIYTVLDDNGVACKLFPQRIEELLSSCEYVGECAVVAKPDTERRYVPVAFITTHAEDDGAVLEELNRISKKELPDHMQPARIIGVPSLPMTHSGKVDYRTLEEMAEH